MITIEVTARDEESLTEKLHRLYIDRRQRELRARSKRKAAEARAAHERNQHILSQIRNGRSTPAPAKGQRFPPLDAFLTDAERDAIAALRNPSNIYKEDTAA